MIWLENWSRHVEGPAIFTLLLHGHPQHRLRQRATILVGTSGITGRRQADSHSGSFGGWGPGIGGGLDTKRSELVDRPVEEKLARALVVVYPGPENAELFRLRIWDGTESRRAFFRLNEGWKAS